MALCRWKDGQEEEINPAHELPRYWKGKGKADFFPPKRSSPLTLPDLPIDILSIIIREVAIRDRLDLFSLLLVNTTFHNTVVPYLYSSVDIMWSDASVLSRGDCVHDPLIRGLCVFAHGSLFLRTMRIMHRVSPDRQYLLEEDYSQFVRRFVVANGSSHWADRFAISSDAGNMVNTLLALALQKMVNLEIFKWDMPSGLSSEIFMALAMLANQPNHDPCKLQQVWVRLHQHRQHRIIIPSPSSSSSSSRSFVMDWNHPAGPPIAPNPPPAVHSSSSSDISSTTWRRWTSMSPYDQGGIEYPTFSILPSLVSITVLDIDLLAYLDELAVLIERSRSILRELRIGISERAKNKRFTKIKGSPDNPQQIDHNARWPGESSAGSQRLGGVLGVILGRVYDISNDFKSHDDMSTPEVEAGTSSTDKDSGGMQIKTESGHWAPHWVSLDSHSNDQTRNSFTTQSDEAMSSRKLRKGKLSLERLELERVRLHSKLCINAFDWSVLTSLKILQCPKSDGFWKALRHHFRPTPVEHVPAGSSTRKAPRERLQYHIALKSIHVDVTTFHLVKFLKETVAPNTLQVLFLQDRRRTNIPPVPLEQIFEGLVKRHSASLAQLLLDSANLGSNGRRKWWALSSEMVSWVTSGRMSSLRELSASLVSSAWHTLLQRLPNIPHLRSLNIPSLGDIPSVSDGVGGAWEVEHLGQQVVNAMTLRPEIQLRFLALQLRCFEIVESRPGESAAGSDSVSVVGRSSASASPSVSASTHAPSSDEAADAGDEDELPSPVDGTEEVSHSSDDVSSHVLESAETAASFNLHEILFYDDKVAIFKARHGKL